MATASTIRGLGRPRRSYAPAAIAGTIVATFAAGWFGLGAFAALLALIRAEFAAGAFRIEHAAFLATFVLTLFAWVRWLRDSRRLILWQVWDHEMLHILAAMISLREVVRVEVDSHGYGKVEVNRRIFLLDQAPYLVTIPMSAIGITMISSHRDTTWWIAAIAGGILAYHMTTILPARWHDKADVQGHHLPFHYVWVAVAMLFWIGIAVAIAWHGGAGGQGFVLDAWDRTLELARSLVR